MELRSRALHLFATPWLLVGLLLVPAVSGGQPLETLKAGVVKLHVVDSKGFDDTGAGIVIGAADRVLFVLTAYHVVKDYESIAVYFDAQRWEPYSASTHVFDEDLDLAVLLVRYSDSPTPPTDLPKYQLRAEDPVYDESVTAIGHPPNLSPWHLAPEHVAVTVATNLNAFLITKTQGDRGFSGGPVFDEDGVLLGLVIKMKAKQMTVVRTDVIVRMLRREGVPTTHIGDTPIAEHDHDEVADTHTDEPEEAEAARIQDDRRRSEAARREAVRLEAEADDHGTGTEEPQMIEVPAVIKLHQRTAERVILAAGLRVGGVRYNDSKTAAGYVQYQKPRAGELVGPGTAVDLLVGRAPELVLVEVPSLVGVGRARAEAALPRLGLRLGKVTYRVARGTADTVLEQTPGAGTRVEPQTAVDLVVNRGRRPAPTRMPARGVYTIQQKSNGRYVDAHESSNQDFRLVTRTAQSNTSQRWILTPLGNNTYTIQQQSNRRYVDAHVTSGADYGLVTRTAQANDTQRWILTPLGNNTYTIRQKSNGRYVDAHVTSGEDYRLVTRTAQNNDTQRWVIRVQ